MSQEEAVLLMIQGFISQMPDEDRVKIMACAELLRATVAEYGELGQLALSLVGAEEAAKRGEE
ncbi:MAG: hypothetical protein AB7R40_22280 [Nitrospiraceae bacterium]